MGFVLGSFAGASGTTALNLWSSARVQPPEAHSKAPVAATTEEKALTAAHACLKRMPFACLSTVSLPSDQSSGGFPTARVVWPNSNGLLQHNEVDIATSSNSRKASQLDGNGKACLLWFDPSTWVYLAVVGTASRIDDLDAKCDAWQEKWRPYFPQGPQASNFGLFRCASSPRSRREVVLCSFNDALFDSS